MQHHLAYYPFPDGIESDGTPGGGKQKTNPEQTQEISGYHAVRLEKGTMGKTQRKEEGKPGNI